MTVSNSKGPTTAVDCPFGYGRTIGNYVGLTDLPYEILDHIISHLPVISTISVKLSCRFLYNVTPSLPSLCREAQQKTEERCQLLYLLYSKTQPMELGPRVLCSGCKTRQEYWAFTSDGIAKRSTERLCIGRKHQVFLNPNLGY